ncbi:MAG: Hpt domain-containing protein, partial [Thermoguttaceae bacterium]
NRLQNSEPNPPCVFDLQQGVEKCFGKYEIFQEMVQCFFDEADDLMLQVRNSQSDGAADKIYQAVHRLRNTLIYLGTPDASEAAYRLEKIAMSSDLSQMPSAIERLDRALAAVRTEITSHRPARS